MSKGALLRLQTQLRRNRLPPIYDPATHWYQDWYFRLRVEEETQRCLRYKYPTSLLLISLRKELGGPLSPERVDFNAELARISQRSLRRSDIPGLLGPQSLAICLPHTSPERAEVVSGRLQRALNAYRPDVSLVELAADQVHLDELLAALQAGYS